MKSIKSWRRFKNRSSERGPQEVLNQIRGILFADVSPLIQLVAIMALTCPDATREVITEKMTNCSA